MNKDKKYYLGIDLGGTNIRWGVFDSSNKLIFANSKPVADAKSPNAIVTLIKGCVDEIKRENGITIASLAAGVPGIVNGNKGIVYASPHYPQWKNVPLAALLTKSLGILVVIDNDANMIAAGEGLTGAGKKLDSFIMLTLGTGIGGSLLINKKIFKGDCGFAGEMGHLVIEKNGHPCACGGRGCLETLVSHSALKRMIRQQMKQGLIERDFLKIPEWDWGLKAYQEARNGHRVFKKMFEEMGQSLAVGIASLANVTGINHFVIGGGLMPTLDLMKPALQKEIKQRTYGQTAQLIKIHKAKLGNQAGLLGCLSVLRQAKSLKS